MAEPVSLPPSPRHAGYNKLGGRFTPRGFSPRPIWQPPGTPNVWAGSPTGSGSPTSCSSTIKRPHSEASGSRKGLRSRLRGNATVSANPAPPARKEAWGPPENSSTGAVKESGRRGNSRNRREAVPRGTEHVERCSRCTKDEMWLAYDVFRSLDKRKRQSVSRNDFISALKDFPTLDKLKILKRAGLDFRFRESTQDVDLPEFLRMLWPSATEKDMVKMVRWAQLREAQAVLRDGKFRGEVAELKKIFDLLDENGDGMLSVNELKRANILSGEEIQTLMRTQRLDAKMTFHDFCIYAQTHLKAMYVSAETAQRMKDEQNQAHTEDFQSSFRAAFARQG